MIDNFGSFAKAGGSVNTNVMWNIKKRVFPKNAKIVPTVKRNLNGQIETNPDTLKKLYAETYQHRLRHRRAKNWDPGILDPEEH